MLLAWAAFRAISGRSALVIENTRSLGMDSEAQRSFTNSTPSMPRAAGNPVNICAT